MTAIDSPRSDGLCERDNGVIKELFEEVIKIQKKTIDV